MARFLFASGLHGWETAGRARFRQVMPGVVEGQGGPGVLWYRPREFDDFVLVVEWRVLSPDDVAGVLLRIPPLGHDDPDNDWRPALEQGVEVDIDERGIDPAQGRPGSALHRSGAVCGLAPAQAQASHPVGKWNAFEITAAGPALTVKLNGVAVAHLDQACGRRRAGYIGLETHHPNARVQFRDLEIQPI